MKTAALYGRTKNLDELAKGLCLLFDHVCILLEQGLADQIVDASPDTLGYLVDEGLVSFEDAPSIFREHGVYQTQRELLAWCVENIDLQIDDREYSSYRRTMRSQAAFEGYFANDFVDQELVERLIDKKWALPIGAEIERAYFQSPDVPDVVLSPLTGFLSEGEATVSESDVMVPSARLPRPTEVPVLLHPSVWALHEALALLALPQAGNARGESWVPVQAEWGNQRRGSKSSLQIDELIASLRSGSRQQEVGHYFSGDFASLNLRLESVPIEEILDFRDSHRNDFDEYLLSMAALLAAASTDPMMGDGLKRHASELVQRTADIHGAALRRWGVRSSILTLSVGGFVWFASQGHWVDGALMGLSGLISTIPVEPPAAPGGAQLFTDMRASFVRPR